MHKKTCLMVLILLTALCSQAAELNGAQQKIQNGQIIFTPQYELPLSDKVVEAIDNGIVITFVMQVKMFQTVDWWFDNLLAHKINTYQVRYFSLFSSYQLHNIRTDEKLSFVSLAALLNYMGQEVAFEFAPDPAADYFETRIFLDKQALPSIMQLPNVFDPDWNFNSDWQKVILEPAS